MGSDSAYGQSGVKWQTWAGTYITGLSKCASSQWGHDQGYNIAAVSYACSKFTLELPPLLISSSNGMFGGVVDNLRFQI